MTLVVEDGTGKADAQSYLSVADANSYLAARGYTLWATISDVEKESCLIRATDFMESYSWKGNRVTTTQALDWPRDNVTAYGLLTPSNIVPKNIKDACAELAFRAASGPLSPDVKPDETGRLPYKEVRKVGPVDVETTWAARGQMAAPAQPVYTYVILILAQFLFTGRSLYR
jgi:hypothetical protein